MPRVWITTALLLALCVGCTSEEGGGSSDGGKSAPAAKPAFDPALATQGDGVFQAKCILCHKRTDAEGPGLMGAPSALSSMKNLPGELSDDIYPGRMKKLETINADYYASKSAQIEAILATPEGDARLVAWLKAYLADPKFDDPQNKMAPVVGLTQNDIEAVVSYLMTFRESK